MIFESWFVLIRVNRHWSSARVASMERCTDSSPIVSLTVAPSVHESPDGHDMSLAGAVITHSTTDSSIGVDLSHAVFQLTCTS